MVVSASEEEAALSHPWHSDGRFGDLLALPIRETFTRFAITVKQAI